MPVSRPDAPAAAGGPQPAPDVLETDAAAGLAIRGGAARIAGHVAGVALGLVSVPFLVRHLGVGGYGQFITVTSIVALIQGVTEAGMTNLAVREYAQADGADRDRFLRDVAGLRFALTIAGVSVTLAALWSTGARPVILTGTAICGAGLLFAATQQTFAVALTAQLKLGWVTVLELVRQATLTVALLVLVIARSGLVWFFVAYVIAAIVVTAATVAVLRDRRVLRPSFHLATWRALLRETLPFAVTAVLGLVYFRIAVILMSYIADERETGYYAAAFRVVEVLAVVPWLLVSSTYPILARAASGDARRLSYANRRVFDVAVIGGAWMTLSVAVIAPFAIEIVAGREFEPAVDVLRILAGAHLTGFVAAAALFALLSVRRYRELMLANAVAVAVAVGGTVLLVPPHGAAGAAVATVAADLVLAVWGVVAIGRDPELRPTAAVVPKVALATAAALAVALLVPAHPLVLVVLATVVYGAVLLPLGAIPPEAIHALRRTR